MNEVSIIINGVRYDAVDAECTYSCEICDLKDVCNDEYNICKALNIHIYDFFKKSDKSLRNDLLKKTLEFNIDGYLYAYCNYPIANNNI